MMDSATFAILGSARPQYLYFGCSLGTVTDVMSVDVAAPITGVVWKVLVKVGDRVATDQSLILLESMKMEVPILATEPGTVSAMLVGPGDAVEEGDTVAKLDAD